MGKNKSKRKPRTEYARLKSLDAKLNNMLEIIAKEEKKSMENDLANEYETEEYLNM